MKDLYFSFEGRIGRKSFWMGMLGLIVVNMVLQGLAIGLAAVSETLGMIFALIALLVALATLVGAFAVQIKRWHDVDKPGWWLLIGFVPVIGLYALYMNGFVKGTEGSNQYGADPLSDVGLGFPRTA